MKKASTLFVQGVIVLIGVAAAAFLLWEPHVEGRNTHATLVEMYFKDPFLAYAYVASIPFFVALAQASKVAGYAGEGSLFSPATAQALHTIKRCALALVGFVAVGEIFIMLNTSDDRAGGVFMGVLVATGAMAMGAAAAMFEKILKKGKNEALHQNIRL